MLKEVTPSEVEEKLKDLPQGLDNMYGHMLRQIPDARREKAISILQWVSVAVRPLTLIELYAAVEPKRSLKTPQEQMKQEQNQFEEEMKEWVYLRSHILAIEGNTVSFVHQPARDYIFREAGGKEPMDPFPFTKQDVNFRIARSCLSNSTAPSR